MIIFHVEFKHEVKNAHKLIPTTMEKIGKFFSVDVPHDNVNLVEKIALINIHQVESNKSKRKDWKHIDKSLLSKINTCIIGNKMQGCVMGDTLQVDRDSIREDVQMGVMW